MLSSNFRVRAHYIPSAGYFLHIKSIRAIDVYDDDIYGNEFGYLAPVALAISATHAMNIERAYRAQRQSRWVSRRKWFFGWCSQGKRKSGCCSWDIGDLSIFMQMFYRDWTMHCFCQISRMSQSSPSTRRYVKSRWSISILIRLWSRESARANSILWNLICTRDWKCDYNSRSDSLWAVPLNCVCGNKSLFVCESFVMRPLWKCLYGTKSKRIVNLCTCHVLCHSIIIHSTKNVC